MKSISKIITLSLATLFLVSISSCTVATSSNKRTVSVSGTGKVEVPSDTVDAVFSVVTRNAEANIAATENASKMTAVQNAIINAGCPKDSIKTSNYSIRQESNYVNGKYVPGVYKVSNQIVISLNDVNLISKIIDTAISNGANELSSLDFGISNSAEVESKARELAAQQAQENAQTLAKSSGAKLGKIISIEETSMPISVRTNMVKATAFESAADVSTPLSSGNASVSVTVQAVYELK